MTSLQPLEPLVSEVVFLCRIALETFFAGENGKSVQAVYLWGSIVRPDFVPGRSDIDAVVLGQGSGLKEICRRLVQEVVDREPVLSNFQARPLHLEDLKGGRPQSELARLIHPKILLADFDNWQLVWGRMFAREDFGLSPSSLHEALGLRLAALRRRLGVHHETPEREPAKYILKEVLFICHVLHQLSEGPHSFSYPALITHANEETREAVKALSLLREGGWQEEECRRVLRLAERFLG